MKTITCIDTRYFVKQDKDLKQLHPGYLFRRFQRYIETSDWDEKIVRKEHLFNKVCMIGVILSGLAVSPFLIAALLK